jgi:hypothetical protein
MLEHKIPMSKYAQFTNGLFTCLLETSKQKALLGYSLEAMAAHLYHHHYCNECIIHIKTSKVLYQRVGIHLQDVHHGKDPLVQIKQSDYNALLALKADNSVAFDSRKATEELNMAKREIIELKKELKKLKEKQAAKSNTKRDLERRMAQVYRRGKQIRRRDREIKNLRKILENRGTLADDIKKSGEYTDTSSVSSDAISDSSKEEEEEEEEEEVVEEESKSKKVTYF